MNDDHGTLRDENDQPLEYRVLDPQGRRSVSLMESQIWPEDMLLASVWRRGRGITQEAPAPGRPCAAESHIKHIEADITKRLGLVPCFGPHDLGAPWCARCRAEV